MCCRTRFWKHSRKLASALQPFSSVVLKGRNNYISLKALQGELDWLADGTREGPADDAAAVALAILCGWVAQTPSGDWADLRTAAVEGHLRSLALFRWKLRVDARPGPSRDRLDEHDFYRRALERLRTAHVAVLNSCAAGGWSAVGGRQVQFGRRRGPQPGGLSHGRLHQGGGRRPD